MIERLWRPAWWMAIGSAALVLFDLQFSVAAMTSENTWLEQDMIDVSL
jgi:hypothetical protein